MSTRNVKNILSTYKLASAAEVDQGMQWYQKAHDDSAALMPDNVERAAGIVAALSPGLRWERNIDAARAVITGHTLDGIGVRWYANVRKAIQIRDGHDPRIVLGGLKVRAFWACIVNPADWFNVCVDGHAYAIWDGKRTPLDETPNLGRGRRYQTIAMDYSRAADSVGILPMQIQAITWTVWRRIHGVENFGNGHLTKLAA